MANLSGEEQDVLQPFVGGNKPLKRTCWSTHGETASALWEKVQRSIKTIQENQHTAFSFEDLYRSAYNLAVTNHSRTLYHNTRYMIRQFLREQMAPLVYKADTPRATLETLLDCFVRHKKSMAMISDINMYLNRTFCPQYEKPTVFECGITLFMEIVIKQQGIQNRLDEALTVILAQTLRDIQDPALCDIMAKLRDMVGYYNKQGEDGWLISGAAAAMVAVVGESLTRLVDAASQPPPGDLNYWCRYCDQLSTTMVGVHSLHGLDRLPLKPPRSLEVVHKVLVEDQTAALLALYHRAQRERPPVPKKDQRGSLLVQIMAVPGPGDVVKSYLHTIDWNAMSASCKALISKMTPKPPSPATTVTPPTTGAMMVTMIAPAHPISFQNPCPPAPPQPTPLSQWRRPKNGIWRDQPYISLPLQAIPTIPPIASRGPSTTTTNSPSSSSSSAPERRVRGRAVGHPFPDMA